MWLDTISVEQGPPSDIRQASHSMVHTGKETHSYQMPAVWEAQRPLHLVLVGIPGG